MYGHFKGVYKFIESLWVIQPVNSIALNLIMFPGQWTLSQIIWYGSWSCQPVRIWNYLGGKPPVTAMEDGVACRGLPWLHKWRREALLTVDLAGILDPTMKRRSWTAACPYPWGLVKSHEQWEWAVWNVTGNSDNEVTKGIGFMA